jgi:hypothetical protein
MTCPLRELRPPLGSVPGWPKPRIVWQHVSQEARAQRVWLTMRSALGGGGHLSKRWRYWLRGCWCEQPSGGKQWPPAIPFPQMRQGLAMIVHQTCQGGTMPPRLRECQRRLQRKERARLDHWKQRNR